MTLRKNIYSGLSLGLALRSSSQPFTEAILTDDAERTGEPPGRRNSTLGLTPSQCFPGFLI